MDGWRGLDMTYTAHGRTVWFGSVLVCEAASEEYAASIVEALREWQAR